MIFYFLCRVAGQKQVPCDVVVATWERTLSKCKRSYFETANLSWLIRPIPLISNFHVCFVFVFCQILWERKPHTGHRRWNLECVVYFRVYNPSLSVCVITYGSLTDCRVVTFSRLTKSAAVPLLFGVSLYSDNWLPAGVVLTDFPSYEIWHITNIAAIWKREINGVMSFPIFFCKGGKRPPPFWLQGRPPKTHLEGDC